ncbi:MAG: exodeoxyribonuclease VII small subunit [Actinomycetota bacterium]|nr:exodeoxyribonuclease VII small subunit [Actinomycetota bacterium]
MTEAPAPAPASALTYADAVAELEAILEGLEGDELDVDHLTAQVARAAELIGECRDRIAKTRFEVERIVTELHPQGPAPGGEGAAGAGAAEGA